MTKRHHRWLIRFILGKAQLIADADSAADKMLQRIEKSGEITHYDAMFGKNYYTLTPAGRAALTSGDRSGG